MFGYSAPQLGLSNKPKAWPLRPQNELHWPHGPQCPKWIKPELCVTVTGQTAEVTHTGFLPSEILYLKIMQIPNSFVAVFTKSYLSCLSAFNKLPHSQAAIVEKQGQCVKSLKQDCDYSSLEVCLWEFIFGNINKSSVKDKNKSIALRSERDLLSCVSYNYKDYPWGTRLHQPSVHLRHLLRISPLKSSWGPACDLEITNHRESAKWLASIRWAGSQW